MTYRRPGLVNGTGRVDAFPSQERAPVEVAAVSGVRARLVERQRAFGRRGGVVMVGRDIGTVVFPDADLKVFLTARADVRAERRSQEVSDLDYETVAADLARRDTLDEGREDSPLAQADDALVLDTSGMSIEEVVASLVAALEEAISFIRNNKAASVDLYITASKTKENRNDLLKNSTSRLRSRW